LRQHEVTNPQECLLLDLGLMAFAEAWDLQRELVAARKASVIPNVLLFCQHPHVITLGRNGKRDHLLASDSKLRQVGVEFHTTDRGGDITYHGPGQLVGYPILDLGGLRKDVVWYVRQLEEAMIRASADFGVVAGRQPGFTGVWVDRDGRQEKLAAIGVHISRWVTSHGFAYNVSTDLSYFDWIVPCGIADKKPTSLERMLGTRISVNHVAGQLTRHLAEVFGLDIRRISRKELEERVHGHAACAV